MTVNCIVLFGASRFCFSLLQLAPTWKTHLQQLPLLALLPLENIASGGVEEFRFLWQSDKNEVKLASGQIVTELRGECGSGQEREGENNWFRTSWELCLNLQPHVLHINSYNSYRELYTCQADRWSTCKHWHGHAAACACACARRTCWAHVPRTLINVSGMWSG